MSLSKKGVGDYRLCRACQHVSIAEYRADGDGERLVCGHCGKPVAVDEDLDTFQRRVDYEFSLLWNHARRRESDSATPPPAGGEGALPPPSWGV